MPTTNETGGGVPAKPKKLTIPAKDKAKKTTKTKKPAKPKKAKAAKKAKSSGTFHETVGAGAGKQTGASLGTVGHPAGSGLAAIELADLGGGAVSGAGLGDVLLDLVGEGQIRLSSALVGWQREQDRVANRAWRRPGGMARMGGL